MSVLDTARAAARHRRKSNRELYVELGRVEAKHDELAGHFNELGRAHLEQRELLDQAGVDVSAALEEARRANERATDLCTENADLQAEVTQLKARLANLDPFHVPVIGGRDVDVDDQVTEPTGIDVRELRDYVNTTPDAWRPKTVTAVRRDVPATPIEVLTLRQQFDLGAQKVTVTGRPWRASA